MPYKVAWYVPNQVVYARMWGDVNLEEFRAFVQEMTRITLESTASQCHAIADTRAMTSKPGLPQMIAASKSSPTTNRAGWSLTIGEINPVAGLASHLITQMTHIRHRRFTTPEEALAFLKEMDVTIAWDEADKSVLRTT
jgi:hypothetical protein